MIGIERINKDKREKLTIFNTPILTIFLRLLSIVIFKIFRWKIVGKAPDIPKYVMIAAPHTSNWDAILLVMTALIYKISIFFLVKDSVFKNPILATIVMRVGGIGVDRKQPNGVVGMASKAIKQHKKIILVVPPEGTRKNMDQWKTGFYWISCIAKVPIVAGFLDYGKKEAGIYYINENGYFHPTGDIDTDFEVLQLPYRNMSGKSPENQCTFTYPGKS